jgi:hypothetical protein
VRLREAGIGRPLNPRRYKHVLSAAIGLDEPASLHRVEPLYRTRRHVGFSSTVPTDRRRTRVMTAAMIWRVVKDSSDGLYQVGAGNEQASVLARRSLSLMPTASPCLDAQRRSRAW